MLVDEPVQNTPNRKGAEETPNRLTFGKKQDLPIEEDELRNVDTHR